MKQHLKGALKLFGERIFFNVLALCMVPVFIAIIYSLSFGPFIFSAVISSLYLGIGFDAVWKIGRHDKQSYAVEKPYLFKGFVIALLAEIPFMIVCIFLFLNPESAPLRAFYRAFCIGPFMGLVPQDRVTVGYALVLLIMPVFGFFGYLVGYRRRAEERASFMEKLLYKSKRSGRK